MLLITYHNLVIGLVSNGLAMALGAYIFIINLNIQICKSKTLPFKGFVIGKDEGFKLFCFTIMFLNDTKMQGERGIDIKVHPKSWKHNARGIHQFKIWKVPFQLIDQHVHYFKTSWPFICIMDAMKKNHAHWLISPNIYIKNVSWIVTTSHVKSKIFCINVKINYPILGDCDKSVSHNITKNLKVFTLLVNHKVMLYIIKRSTWLIFTIATKKWMLPFLGHIWWRNSLPPIMATHKTRQTMFWHDKKNQNSTLLEQQKCFLVTFWQLMSCILLIHVSKAPTLISIVFWHSSKPLVLLFSQS